MFVKENPDRKKKKRLKGISFYGKTIEDLGCHKSTKFTHREMVVEKALRSPVRRDGEENVCSCF